MMVDDLQDEYKPLVDTVDIHRALVYNTQRVVDKQPAVAVPQASLVQPVVHLSPAWAEQPVVLAVARALVVVAVLRIVADTADIAAVDTVVAVADTVAAVDTAVVAELVEPAIVCSIRLHPEQQLPNHVDLELPGSWSDSLRNKLCRKFSVVPAVAQQWVEQLLPELLE
jgi:hypothetical protein